MKQLRALDPETFTTEVLADRFKISPEAVRRILKSKWMPSKERKDQLTKREKAAREQVRAVKATKLREDALQLQFAPKRENNERGRDRDRRRYRERDQLTMN